MTSGTHRYIRGLEDCLGKKAIKNLMPMQRGM
jgi:hypothetical protein